MALHEAMGRNSQPRPTRRLLWTIEVASLVLLPAVTSIDAAYSLPAVELCGPNFSTPPRAILPQLDGNLIGTDGQYVYIAAFIYNVDGTVGRAIEVVPLSAVQLESIGLQSCNGLKVG